MPKTFLSELGITFDKCYGSAEPTQWVFMVMVPRNFSLVLSSASSLEEELDIIPYTKSKLNGALVVNLLLVNGISILMAACVI